MMDLWVVFGDLVVLLAGCLLLGGLFSRFGQSPLVGYLLAGMMLGGPGSFGVIRAEGEIEAIAELGVALLLFSLGLEFSVKRLRKLGLRPLMGGVLQVALTIILGAGAALLFRMPIRESFAFGAMIALSSTAVVLRILMERAELDMPHGRNSLAVLLTQDMAVVPLALLMTILGGGGDGASVALDVGKLLLVTVGLVAGFFLLSRVAMLVLGNLTLHRNRELTILLAVVTGLGAAWAAHAAGISPALGAFVAGMLLGSSAFATQIRSDISSLRVILLTLFFGAAGMVADPMWILKNWHLVAGVAVLLTLGKLIIIWATFRMLGHTTRVALATGFCLAQIGEFAFVLGSVGRTAGVVSADMYALVVSVTIVSFILSAFLVPGAVPLADRVCALFGSDAGRTEGDPRTEEPPEIVIFGFGPAAQIASGSLSGRRKRVVVVDLNQEGVQRARRFGFQGQIGDATQSEVLEHVRIGQAKLILITIPNYRSALAILEDVKQRAPQAHLIIRSRYQMHSDDFVSAGGDVVVGDEEQVGERLAKCLSQWLDETGKSRRATAESATRT